jgi:Mrp family chromosome partitioning ATPase
LRPRNKGDGGTEVRAFDRHPPFGIALVRIRTARRAPQSSEGKQVILVISAQPGDGKTSFCVGLARLLALSRMRVLVIDAAPYRSQLAAAFGAPQVRLSPRWPGTLSREE